MIEHPRSLFWVAVVAALLHLGNQPALAQEDIAISILSVDDSVFPLVTAVISADQSGRPLTQIAPVDLAVEESGAPATLLSIRRASDDTVPLALVVAFDVSGSMAGETLSKAQTAAISLIHSLGPADRSAIVAFSETVRLEQPLTHDKGLLEAAVSRLRAEGSTALYDAVAESARVAIGSGLSRRAVVLLSDGKESGEASRLSREQSLAIASEAGTLFYVVGVGTDVDGVYLEALARRSGGRLFEAFGAAEIPAVYSLLAETLRAQFVLTLRATSAAALQERSVKVSLTRLGPTASAERVYQSLRPPPSEPPSAPPISPAVSPITVTASPPSGWPSAPPIALLVVGPVAVLGLLAALKVTKGRKDQSEFGPTQEAETLALETRGTFSDPTWARLHICLVAEGSEKRRVEVGEHPITIGSGDRCRLQVPAAPGVAGEHARVWLRDGRLMLHHLASGEETRVGGKSVIWASLGEEDEVVIGPYLLRCLGQSTDSTNGRPHEPA